MVNEFCSVIQRLKRIIKSIPYLVSWKRALLPNEDGLAGRSKIEILRSFPLFIPYSEGIYSDRARLTLLAINKVFPSLEKLAQTLGHDPLPVLDVRIISDSAEKIEAAKSLKLLFDDYGSDKANHHNFHYLYGAILQNRHSISKIFEIGLGTNNEDVVSNMGLMGHPGASLRAFRDFCPNAMIYGADIDRRILFSEDRISTHFIDQTDTQSMEELLGIVPRDFDLVIDDGLHSPNANISSLEFGLKILKKGGWMVVEDINQATLPLWQCVCAMVGNEYVPYIFQADGSFIFCVQKVG